MNGARIIANAGPGDSVIPPVPGGGKGGFVGVLMLDTKFPRPLGDIGHPGTLGMPVRHSVVEGAWPSKVVAGADTLRASGLAGRFASRARELEREGACAITTSCGFLILLQRELQEAVSVPVVTSSLLHLPRLLASEPRVGVLTISAAHLGREHLLAAGVAPERLGDVLVQGVDSTGEFARAILHNRATMDLTRAQANVVSAALELKARAPDLCSLVLECTNMPPYAPAVRAATQWRLYSLLDAFGRET